MGKNHQWADTELTAFYQHYHNTTKDWTQVSSSQHCLILHRRSADPANRAKPASFELKKKVAPDP
jgi:hypothetical protein